MNQIHFSPIHISWASSLCNLIITVVSVNVLVGAVLLPRPSEPNAARGSKEELREWNHRYGSFALQGGTGDFP